METFNFSTEKFLEPTQKYINEWYDKPYIKELYNLDLLWFVRQYKYKSLYDYNYFQKLYDLPNIEDIVGLFSDYSINDEIELGRFNKEKNFNL